MPHDTAPLGHLTKKATAKGVVVAVFFSTVGSQSNKNSPDADDETGKRAPKWIATHLSVQGNKRRTEEKLLQARQQYTDIYGKPLDKLRGHWMYMPVVLSVFYGLRRSEVMGFQRGSVDFENETITIQHTRIYGNSDGTDDVIERDILKRKSSYVPHLRCWRLMRPSGRHDV